MRPEEFWKLSFYEWSLWVSRIVHLQDKRRQDQELLIELQRRFMSLYANSVRRKNSRPYKPSDFFKLSSDKSDDEQEKEESERISEEELKRRVQEQLNHRRKKNG